MDTFHISILSCKLKLLQCLLLFIYLFIFFFCSCIFFIRYQFQFLANEVMYKFANKPFSARCVVCHTKRDDKGNIEDIFFEK